MPSIFLNNAACVAVMEVGENCVCLCEWNIKKDNKRVFLNMLAKKKMESRVQCSLEKDTFMCILAHKLLCLMNVL